MAEIDFGFVHSLPVSITVEWVDRDGNVRRIEIPPGEATELTFTDPCDASNFISAAAEEVHSRGGSASMPQTRAGIAPEDVEGGVYPGPVWTPDNLRSMCQEGGGQPGEISIPPPEPPPIENPSDTDVPEEDRTTENLAPPEPGNRAAFIRNPYRPFESSGNLADDFYRQQNPMPEHDVAQHLADEGVPPEEVENALDDVRHNEPPPGAPHPHFGQDITANPLTENDPVDVFAGQYYLTVTDVHIPSRGFPLQLTRTYRSGPVYFGPWGYNWDHNYNLYLRELSDSGIAIWTGRLTEHEYQLNPDGSYEPPTGVYTWLERQTATPLTPDRYVLTDRSGMQLIFARPEGWPNPVRIPLVRVEDRHGNAHQLAYDSEGRLQQVEDHAGRFIHFGYGNCGLLEWVTDHTGRTWRYMHDSDVEHLVAVVTPGTSEYPDGLMTCYEYDRFRRHPALLHNLTRVIDPAGQTLVENRYGDDPDTRDFGRVVSQLSAGCETRFRATSLQYVPRVPGAINVPALRVEVVANNVYTIYTFNYRGDLLDERFRLVRDRSYRLVARIYRYDEQGNLIEQREPNGLGTLYVYDHENMDPRARANLLQVNLVSPPTRLTAAREVVRLTYEPRYHRVKTWQNEAGDVTTFVYDYEETTSDRGNIIRIEYPTATLPDGTSQPKVERFSYNSWGQIIEYQTGVGYHHTFRYETTGPSDGYLRETILDTAGVAQQQNFEYDNWGFRSLFVDGLGRQTEYVRNAIGQLESIKLPSVNGTIDEVRFFYESSGNLRREEWPRGHYDDEVIVDPFIAHVYKYDQSGYLTEAVYGANCARSSTYQYRRDSQGRILASEDPLGRWTFLTYNERGQLLTLKKAAGTQVEAIWRYQYDRNGNRTTSIDPAGNRIDYEFDPWDRLLRVILPGAPETERTQIELSLNHFDKIERIHITGRIASDRVGTLLNTTTEYDERGRPWRRHHEGKNQTLTYDADGRVIAQTNHKGNMWTFSYDGLNRIVASADPIGNGLLRHYDIVGNLIRVERQGMVPDGGGTETFATRINYDDRNRPVEITYPSGQISQLRYDARDYLVSETYPLGHVIERTFGLNGELLRVTSQESSGIPVVHRFIYDRIGREIAYHDPEERITRYTYDELNRRTALIHPDGRIHSFQYNAHHQLNREESPSGTVKSFDYGVDGGLDRINFIPGPGVAATLPLIMDRDGLGRPIRLQQGDKVIERTYDASLRLRSESFAGQQITLDYDDTAGTAHLTYPDGRIDQLAFDPLERLSSITLQEIGTALLTGSLAAETEIVRYTYRGPERVARRELHNGLITEFDYDRIGRLTAIQHLDSSASSLSIIRYVYDIGDRRRVIWSGPLPQKPAFFDYDDLSRLRLAKLDLLSLPEPESNLSQAEADSLIVAAERMSSNDIEQYNLNRSDARTEVSLQKDGSTTTDHYSLGAAYQITQLERHGTHGGRWRFIYDGDGRCIQDARYRYIYNALGQLIEIRDITSSEVLLVQEFDPAGRVVARTEDENRYEQRYLGLRVLQREGAGGIPFLQFTYGVGLDEFVLESNGSNKYPLQDAGSNLLAYTNESGVVLERYHYTPFGKATIWNAEGRSVGDISALGATPRFGGHSLLKVGLYDVRARVYDPNTARFLQPDPLGHIASSNLYTYAHHNPNDFIDPDGANPVLAIAAAAGIGLLVGGIIGGVGVYLRNPEADWEEIAEGIAVGAVAGAVTGATGTWVAGLAASVGTGVVWSGVFAGVASGGAGGAVSGGYYGGRQAYVESGGDIGATAMGAGAGALREGALGYVGGGVGGAVTGRVWAGVVRQGALPPVALRTIARGGAAPPSPLISPNSFLGNAAIGVAGNSVDATVQLTATTGLNYLQGRPVPTFADWGQGLALSTAGGLGSSLAHRYIPRSGGNMGNNMYEYARRWRIARTREGAQAILHLDEHGRLPANTFFNEPPFTYRERATAALREHIGVTEGGYIHHDLAVTAYPELFEHFDILRYCATHEEHVWYHETFGVPNPHAPPTYSNRITHGPTTPRYPGGFLHVPLGLHNK